MKVLFYTHTSRAFRTTTIGHLYEIAREHPVVLLTEKLDPEIDELIRRTDLFPKLLRIISVNQFSGKEGYFNSNRRMLALAKQVIRDYRPDIVVAGSDMHSMFEMYLLRYAKKARATTVCIQPTIAIENVIYSTWVDLLNIYGRFPSYFPYFIKKYAVLVRKYLGHILYHWLLPLSVFEFPLIGRSSSTLRKGNSGLRDADYQVVFSEEQYHRWLKDGIDPKKLIILEHPLKRSVRSFFMDHILKMSGSNIVPDRKSVTILYSAEEIGFTSESHALLGREYKLRQRLEIIRTIVDILHGWTIYIKPHPDYRNFQEVADKIRPISKSIIIVQPSEPVDRYLNLGDAIIEVPRASSTATYMSPLYFPNKPVIALDFDHELTGDILRDIDGIEYIDSHDGFISALKHLRDGSYRKPAQKTSGISAITHYVSTNDVLKSIFNVNPCADNR